MDKAVKKIIPSKDLLAFWKDIYWLPYMSGVMSYEYNEFDKILKKYGLSRVCRECGQPIKNK